MHATPNKRFKPPSSTSTQSCQGPFIAFLLGLTIFGIHFFVFNHSSTHQLRPRPVSESMKATQPTCLHFTQLLLILESQTDCRTYSNIENRTICQNMAHIFDIQPQKKILDIPQNLARLWKKMECQKFFELNQTFDTMLTILNSRHGVDDKIETLRDIDNHTSPIKETQKTVDCFMFSMNEAALAKTLKLLKETPQVNNDDIATVCKELKINCKMQLSLTATSKQLPTVWTSLMCDKVVENNSLSSSPLTHTMTMLHKYSTRLKNSTRIRIPFHDSKQMCEIISSNYYNKPVSKHRGGDEAVPPEAVGALWRSLQCQKDGESPMATILQTPSALGSIRIEYFQGKEQLQPVGDQQPPRCQKGPYFYDIAGVSGFATSPGGIGSTLNHLQYGMFIAQLLNLTYIPNPGSLRNQLHQTDFSGLLGLEEELDCSADDFHVLDDDVGRSVQIAMRKAANITVKESPGGGPTVVYIRWNTLHETMTNDQYLWTACQQYDPRQAARGDPAALVDLFPIPRLRSLLMAVRAWIRDPTTIVVLVRGYCPLLYGYSCLHSVLRHKYLHRRSLDEARGMRRSYVPKDPRVVVIAFHYRRGDGKSDKEEEAHPEVRALSVQKCVTVLRQIVNNSSSVLGGYDKYEVHVLSEAHRGLFVELETAFPTATFHWFTGDNSSTTLTASQTVDHFASADVFIGGSSSFSTMGMLYNANGALVAECGQKCDGLPNAVPFDDVIDGHMSHFNAIFCANTRFAELCRRWKHEHEPKSTLTSKG